MKAGLGLIALCGFALGCATATFTPYVGQQQMWPTAPGAILDTNAVVPIYHGLPDRPYEVLGQLDAAVAPIRESGILKYAAKCAKERGADAILLLSRSRELAGFSGTSYGQYGAGHSWTAGNSSAHYSGQATILLIQFTSPSKRSDKP